jgi:hypothetical protein
MLIWGKRWMWAARLVYDGSRMGYRHRGLAPISTRFKIARFRDDL